VWKLVKQMGKKDRGAQPSIARDAAIDWLLRLDEGELTGSERARFDAWIASDPANKAAFDDMARMLEQLSTMDLAASAPRRVAFRFWKTLAWSSALVASILLVAFYSDLSLYIRSDYYAGTGQTKSIVLEDGSNVQLDAASAITVRFDGQQRRLVLLEGQALFEVAPDSARPFIVEAAGGTITALGTAFDVAIEKKQTQVVVTSHRVAVASGGSDVIVQEGQQSSYRDLSPARPAEPADVERVTSWRHGKLMFENRRLDDVIGVFARYHRGAVYVLNPALRSRRVTGVFSIDDPLLALREIQVALGLHMISASDFLVLVY
jgi:transmembrane sensor